MSDTLQTVIIKEKKTKRIRAINIQDYDESLHDLNVAEKSEPEVKKVK